MALRNEIGMQASTFVKSSFSFCKMRTMSKPVYSRLYLGDPCLGLRHSCWTEPIGYFEPPPKKSHNCAFQHTFQIRWNQFANEIIETMTATARQKYVQTMKPAWMKNYCGSTFVSQNIVCMCMLKGHLFSVSRFPIYGCCSMYFCGNGQFSFGPSYIFISYQLWVNGNFEMLLMLLLCVLNYMYFNQT